MPLKGDRAPKKPKVSLEPVIGLMVEGARTVTPAKHGAGKGLMVASPGSQKKPPVLLHEDPQYALVRLSSIITSKNYEDLGNHSTKAIGGMGLFNIAQVIFVVFLFVYVLYLKLSSTLFQAMLMMKGLIGRCLNHKTTLGQVRKKARLMEDELLELKNWKLVTEEKLKLVEQARDEYYKLTEDLKKTLEDKEKEIRQAKEVAVLEYRDSDSLLSKLKVSYNDGFDDAFRQVKALYPELDVSCVNINVPKQTSIQPAQSEDTNELFGDDVPISNAPVDLTVEGEPKDGEARHVKEIETPAAS